MIQIGLIYFDQIDPINFNIIPFPRFFSVRPSVRRIRCWMELSCGLWMGDWPRAREATHYQDVCICINGTRFPDKFRKDGEPDTRVNDLINSCHWPRYEYVPQKPTSYGQHVFQGSYIPSFFLESLWDETFPYLWNFLRVPLIGLDFYLFVAIHLLLSLPSFLVVVVWRTFSVPPPCYLIVMSSFAVSSKRVSFSRFACLVIGPSVAWIWRVIDFTPLGGVINTKALRNFFLSLCSLSAMPAAHPSLLPLVWLFIYFFLPACRLSHITF